MPDLRPKPDHVVFDFMARSMACRHCGHSQPVAMPISVTFLVQLTNGYIAQHGECLAEAAPMTAGAP